MRTNTIVNLMVMATTILLWACGPESNHPLYQDFSNGTPEPVASNGSHPAPYPICSDKVDYPIVDEQGGTKITYCGGPPCSGPQPDWGTATIFNDSASIYLDFALDYEWFVSKIEVFAGNGSQITWSQGLPQPDAIWQVELMDHALSCYEMQVPVGAIGGQCPSLAVKIECYKMDFYSGADSQSVRSLYVGDTLRDNNGTPTGLYGYEFPWCFESCAPAVTRLAGGECLKCDAEMEVEFYGCDSVAVNSCKDLSNVVLVFTDGDHQKFDGLSQPSGVFIGEGKHAGKAISRVYVKSGCFESGDGPDFGRRFDGPC